LQVGVEGVSVQLPAQQQTLAGQLCEPEQSIAHVPAEQVRAPWHDDVPVHPTMTVLPDVATEPAQDPFPEQVKAHELAEHETSEAQVLSPLQVIATVPAPLLTLLWQAFAPLQATVQVSPAQLIEPAHEFDCVQAISQPVA
jgi:hypothetical protein